MELIKTVTPKEAAVLLGVHYNTVFRYIDDGTIKAIQYQHKGLVHIPVSEIERLLKVKEAN